jgi:glutamate carboxypeptidase
VQKLCDIVEISKWVECHEEEMFHLLETAVNIDSPTMDEAGLTEMKKVFVAEATKSGFHVETVHQPDYGYQIIATTGPAPSPQNPKVLLVGHMDTVFPRGTVANHPFSNDGNMCRGPGVADMKGGLVSMLFATRALAELLGRSNMVPMELIFTPDEELGSPTSGDVIMKQLDNCKAAFVLEPGRPDGSVVTSRKGSCHFRLDITGKAAHSALNFDDGVSAISDLAMKIVEINGLTNLAEGDTVNIGLIQGGKSANTVAPNAWCRIHCMYTKLANGKRLVENIREIAGKSHCPGTTAVLTGGLALLPMEKTASNDALFQHVKACAEGLGFSLTGVFTKGASDAGTPSSRGIPTICAMGPVGGNLHTPGEYMLTKTLAERTKLLAVAIRNLDRNEFFSGR